MKKIKYHFTNAMLAVAQLPADMLTFVIINVL